MPLSSYEKQRLEQLFDEMDHIERQRALASESAFQRWLKRIAPAIFYRVQSALNSLWNWLRGL
jgi:hypothetical protein